MKIRHSIRYLPLLTALFVAPLLRADFTMELAALKDFAGLRPAQSATPSAAVHQTSEHSSRVTEAAVALYEKYPAEPARWEAALVALKTLRSFVTEVKPGYDEAIAAKDMAKARSLLVRDDVAQAAWDAKVDALQEALFAASDVAPGVLADAYANAVYQATLRRNLSPAARWARVKQLIEAMEKRVTEAKALTRALDLGTRFGRSVDARDYEEFVRARAQSPVPAVAAWASVRVTGGAVKQQASAIKFTAIDGREVDIAKLRGKVVLIDFWATWCLPCKEELPNVLANYRQYHDRGFEVVAISLDSEKDRQKLIDFCRENALPWPQFFDGKGWKNEFAVKFSITAIPAMFLLDQEGRLVSTDARGAALEREIKRLLNL